jgi:N-acetylglutamate synthase-like GNAT family acetyltransferase
MTSSNYRVRRATLDDVRPLMALWQSMNYPADELVRRMTEFQVAENTAGTLLGAVGLQVAERQGCIHSEAFTDFALADHLRPLLWERLHAVAANLGVFRLWTREQAPFWSHSGMVRADAEVLAKLPAPWRGHSAGWLTLKLREDLDAVIKADHEFSLFMAAEKQRTNRVLVRARILKAVVTVISFGLLALAIGVAIYLLRRNSQILGR